MPPVHIDLPPLFGLPRVEPTRPPMSTFSDQRFSLPLPLHAPHPSRRIRTNESEAWPFAIVPRYPYPMALHAALSAQLIHGNEGDQGQYLWAHKLCSVCKSFVKHIRAIKEKIKDGITRLRVPGFDIYT